MESFSDHVSLVVIRPLSAVLFVFSFILIGWALAWKLVLVHVPLVQEIFGLKKKQFKPKPPTRRLSKLYSAMEARNSTSPWLA
uniref:Uncharacterized protein n=2 Tax=Kalanchoe fedtschenkoi TaxID=63787 RepID=A0A7N0SWD9_KALFE